MSSAERATALEFGPWHPGLASRVPDDLRHLSTIFRPDCVATSLAKALELHDFTGIDCAELVAFRPRRLLLHETLVRVTADFSVPDGPKIEDLGINFRRMVRVLLEGHFEPRIAEITSAYDATRSELLALIERELVRLFSAPALAPTPSRIRGLFARFASSRAASPAPGADAEHEASVVAEWQARSHSAESALERAATRALARVVSALLVKHGRLWGGRELIASIATDMAANDAAGEVIGGLIDPWLASAAEKEGYRRLPRQGQPVVMNTKGPSAAGKSTIRPLQRALAERIGVDWTEFALISPDIWRKQLLDYGTLGAAYKYGGAFTAEELRIVDQKLDRYMAHKAERGRMSHLLIDRFRFDSFAPDSDEAGSNLLTRFGRIVYLFFLITPPADLVVRAWNRGLEVGRYKAVDDTLAHAIEAYAGMPELFFTWIQRADKRVHFEFLDNSVKQGERPRTVAFGWNEVLNVLDVKCLLDVERYRKLDVDATGPEALYRDRKLLAPEHNTAFLRQCAEKFRVINFADQSTGRIYLRIAPGAAASSDADVLAQVAANPDTRAGLLALVPTLFDRGLPAPERSAFLSRSEEVHTVGSWGS
jgi:hypothetical protein